MIAPALASRWFVSAYCPKTRSNPNPGNSTPMINNSIAVERPRDWLRSADGGSGPSMADPRGRDGWMDHASTRRGYRLSPGREPSPQATTRSQTAPTDRRPTPQTGGSGSSLGRRALAELASLVTPDTILRWHDVQALIARGVELFSQASEANPWDPYLRR